MIVNLMLVAVALNACLRPEADLRYESEVVRTAAGLTIGLHLTACSGIGASAGAKYADRWCKVIQRHHSPLACCKGRRMSGYWARH